jgi:AP2 domain
MPRRPRTDFYLHWVEDPKLGVRGWKIRVPYFDQGRLKYRRKLVSEFRFGGTKESLRVIAIRLRDKLIAELGASTFGAACFQRQKSRRNTSGHIGVNRYVVIKKGERQIIWSARWVNSQGKMVMKRFLAKHRGEEEAKELAIRSRAEGVRQTAQEISQTLLASRQRTQRPAKSGATHELARVKI